jgi:hypothetical protein
LVFLGRKARLGLLALLGLVRVVLALLGRRAIRVMLALRALRVRMVLTGHLAGMVLTAKTAILGLRAIKVSQVSAARRGHREVTKTCPQTSSTPPTRGDRAATPHSTAATGCRLSICRR